MLMSENSAERTPVVSNALSSMVTKVPQVEEPADQQQDLHKQHFVQTVQALQFIKSNIRIVEPEEMQDLLVDLPPPKDAN